MKRTYDINSILGRIPGNEAFYAQQDANEQNKERINKQIIDTYGPSYGEYHKEARILRDHLSIKAAEITNEYLQKTALIGALGSFLIGVVTAFMSVQSEKTNIVKLESDSEVE